MGSFGPLEIILIFLVVLLIFGAKRIPEIARGIGKGIREFKDATSEISQELESSTQNRQINQPRSPSQGETQARTREQQTSSTQESTTQAAQQEPQQQESAAEAPASGDDAAAETAEKADQKESS